MFNFTVLEHDRERLLKSYNGRRLYFEIRFVHEIVRENNLNADDILNDVINIAVSSALTDLDVEKCEAMLKPLAGDCKKQEVICVGHAHIDMDWQWGYDETVAITLSTFRTTLDLMNEYDFTFGQSQVSCYEIVKEFDSDMFEEIKQRIKEGRWEVTASSWVETDRNMPSIETHIRQFLYSKEFLEKEMGLKDGVKISFEPDTFGHNEYMPELFSKAGVKWQYHCRGDVGEYIYRWRAKSGAEVLVYREPIWYNTGNIDYQISDRIRQIISFGKKYNLDKFIQVFGVGDHGGGVTRQELDEIKEIQTYPLFPTIRYGSYNEYFEYLETKKDTFSIVEGELNPIFDGCYTSQERIKSAFKKTEKNLSASDACNLIGVLNGGKDNSQKIAEGWKNLMFTTFHDILPGSCTEESKNYALGLLQKASASAESARTLALRNISESVDLSSFDLSSDCPIKNKKAEGAGVGFINHYRSTYDVSKSDSPCRAFVVFNELPFDRDIYAEIPLFDWDIPFYAEIEAVTSDGEKCELQLLDNKPISYWLHKYIRVLVKVRVKSCGYKTIVLKTSIKDLPPYILDNNFRCQIENKYVKENESIRVEFNQDLTINNLYDKKTGKEIPCHNFGELYLIKEDVSFGMVSWIVGRYSDMDKIPCDIAFDSFDGELRNTLKTRARYKNSSFETSYITEGKFLKYSIKGTWKEDAEPDRFLIPQLSFAIALDEDVKVYKSFFGNDRQVVPTGVDFVANKGVYVEGKNGEGFILLSKNNYGFRFDNGKLQLTLLRSACDPARFTEYGDYIFDFAICPIGENNVKDINQIIEGYYAEPICSAVKIKRNNVVPADNSMISLDSKNCLISDIAFKEGEAIIRVENFSANEDFCKLIFNRPVLKAWTTDFIDNKIDRNCKICSNIVTFMAKPYAIETVKIKI